MKKLFTLTLIAMFAFCGFASARVQYDSTGRNIVQDNTIRGQKRQAQYTQERKIQAAAAARINYDADTNRSQPVSDWAKKHTYKTFEPRQNYNYYQR